MSPPLEQRACPDCGAIFHLIPDVAFEFPPHGCVGSAEQTEPSAQSAPATAPTEGDLAEPKLPAGPQDLFQGLQDAASQQPESESPATAAPTGRGELKDETAQSLRERGYVITEDAHGVRISGSPHGGPGGRDLSPSDIVRIAAELDGGVKQAGNLQTCAKCQARTAAGEAKCQWCGEPFPLPAD